MQLKDKKDEVELMTFNLNYQRWYDLYFPKDAAALVDTDEYGGGGGTLVQEEIELPVTEIDELDAFFEGRENTRWMTGSDLPEEFLDGMGVGRKV